MVIIMFNLSDLLTDEQCNLINFQHIINHKVTVCSGYWSICVQSINARVHVTFSYNEALTKPEQESLRNFSLAC